MGSLFTSPVPPVALRACWTVTGNTNNALTAPSNLSPADTSAARRAADGRGRAGCALPRLHGKKSADFSLGGQGKWARGPRCGCGGFFCACVYICKYSFCVSSGPPSTCVLCVAGASGEAEKRRGLGARLAAGAPDLRGPFHRPAA